ncbi:MULTISPECIES: HNH endonuclease signature motif containing protein [unclassified Microbacterium]|uniref:HNH endonuclease signature motif containing protein n=1 Tax=unclassified Microbacterium TaxID=2609290 RepID=UPI00214C84B1|nr:MULTISPECIES: HNH endonuclease signature motif containing protein [unclassified Microbacterium]MCR2784189.1 HNH endonuclease [Microbacterium sp. zg.B96]WIM14979.1 DUF222 domain-containing protein [Microbacterium sp. zg-B96]
MNTSPTTTARTAVLSHEQVISGLEEVRRRRAQADADEVWFLSQAEAVAEAETARIPTSDGREREMPLRGMAAEVGAVLRRSDHGMRDRMHDATVLVDEFAATFTALREDRIDRVHVRIIQDAGARITDPDARARFEQAALVVCEKDTPGRAKPLVLMLAQRLNPVPLEERHKEAAAGRRVWVRDLDDGMAELAALLPAELVYAMRDRLNQHARQIADAHRAAVKAAAAAETEAKAEAIAADVIATDTRTMDQIRADVLTDLLLTGHATAPEATGAIPEGTAIVAQVQVVIPANTLIGIGDEPAELVGYGPISPDTARRLAATADVWERLFTSPTSGAVEQVLTYRPTREMRRHLDARDEHCRFLGCRRPARQCDLDHTHDAALGGPTCLTNLANLCPGRHHPVKHGTAWSVVQKAHGILEWTSPTGRVYTDIPRRVLEFMALAAIEEPAPF